MRLFWASHSGRIGGAELCLFEGAAALRALGVELLVGVPERGPLAERLAGIGVGTAVVPLAWWARPAGEPTRPVRTTARQGQSAYAALRAVRAFRPDLVVTNTVVIPGAAVAARACGVPHVWYLHEYGDRDHGLAFNYGFRASMGAVRRLSSRVLVNSTALERHFAPHLGATPVERLDYAVEVPETGGLPEPAVAEGPAPALEVVLVGARHEGKRQEDAIRAMARLRARGADAALTLVGPSHPRYEAHLLRVIEQERLADRVRLVGHTDAPFRYFGAADVAVMCSTNEAFGRVTVEAMKLGLPVVGAASGGTLDLIEDGVNGLLYRPGDPADLAEKLEWLHHHPDARCAMGRAAREGAMARFSAERYGETLLGAFNRARAS